MPRKYDDYDDGFEVRRREPEEEPFPLREERRPVRRRRTEEPETKKAPLLIRIIAWLAVVAFCFVAGYVGTSFALRMLNKKDILMRRTWSPTGRKPRESSRTEALKSGSMHGK